MKWIPENELNYRVVKTMKGYEIQKQHLVNVGWILFPDYEIRWIPLDHNYNKCLHWSQDIKYYVNEGQAVSIAQDLKNKLYEVVYETKNVKHETN